MERTDASGRWESFDDGVSWSLVEPSQAWLDERAAQTEPATPDPRAIAIAAVAEAASLDELRDATLAYLTTIP